MDLQNQNPSKFTRSKKDASPKRSFSLLETAYVTAGCFFIVLLILVIIENGFDSEIFVKISEWNLQKPYVLVRRTEWGAYPPRKIFRRLVAAHTVLIGHTKLPPCWSRAECIPQLRRLQHLHMDRCGNSDISYSYLVGGDGRVYEGRGWETGTGPILICFMGTFDTKLPTQRQLDVAHALITEGVRRGFIDGQHEVKGERQVASTRSPGEALFRYVQTWPHWGCSP